ncbi:conserved hypothetical protein, partial [Ricinus communis]
MAELLVDTLQLDCERVSPLATFFHESSRGNALFAVHALRSLHHRALCFDVQSARWTWDAAQITKDNTSNRVMVLMAFALQRVSPSTRNVLAVLACIGVATDTRLVCMVRKTSLESLHLELREASLLGLVTVDGERLAFTHDWILDAAYALIPADERSRTHLGIGRTLYHSLNADDLDRHLFVVVNQFNSALDVVTEEDERQVVAGLNRRAGQRAKASTAYASASAYLANAMSLAAPDVWNRDHAYAVSLWLERAECEFFSRNLSVAQDLAGTALEKMRATIELAKAYRIIMDVHVLNGDHDSAIRTGLECLLRYGVDIPLRPTYERVEAEHARIFDALRQRPIASLIDLPTMQDPEVEAILHVLMTMFGPSIFVDSNLASVILCQMVLLNMRHGNSPGAAVAYGFFGTFLGKIFQRYSEGYEFGKLAENLIEKHGLVTHQARVYFSMEVSALWARPIKQALHYLDLAMRAAERNGDLTIACYARTHLIADLLLRGDLLEEVSMEATRCIDFVSRANFRDAVDTIHCQQRFILAMQGKTNSLSKFSGGQFDEHAFEAQLGSRIRTMVCWYWILKLEARYLSGDINASTDARQRAEPLLSSSAGHIQLLSYHYFGALAITSAWDGGLLEGGRDAWRERLDTHAAQLREWAAHGSSTFADKYELIVAETLRIEGRQLEAMHWYEKAIRSAQDNGFFHTQGVACEAAGRFYLSCGLETNGIAHLREARRCFARWGAEA